MRILLAFVLALGAAGLWARPASAQDLISVEPRVPADFPARLKTRLSKEAPRRLAATGVPVRSGADIEVAARAAADCADAACLKERLAATGARAAVRLTMTQTEAGFTAALDVTSLSSGRSLAHEEADCGGCAASAAIEVALSLIDGLQIPENEPEEPAPPPPPVETAVPVPEVPPEAVEPDPPSSDGPPPLVWAGLGAGGLLVLGSIPLFLTDGVATCDGPRQSCPEVYDTMPAGIAAVSIGGALIIGAVVLWILDKNDEPAPSEATPP
jgi:hypothetical protein